MARRMNAYISKLPIELLETILELVVQNSQKYLQIRLCRVNRCFHRIAIPLIYQHLNALTNRRNLCKNITRARLLYRTYIENPNLKRYCQRISITLRDYWDGDPKVVIYVRLMHSILSILPKVTTFDFNGGFKNFQQDSWSLVRTALDNMPLLKSLSLDGSWGGLSGSDILLHVATIPEIITLKLNGFYLSRTLKNGPTLPPRTATFTSLHVKEYKGRPDEIHDLINWPQTLRHFKLSEPWGHMKQALNLNVLGCALIAHQETLETLQILSLGSYFAREGEFSEDKMLDLTAFSKLRQLTLSHWSIDLKTPLFYPNIVRKILAPNLEKFTWDFVTYWDSWMQFGPIEVNWIRTLGNYAAHIGSPLRYIYVDFNPDSIQVSPEAIYPWTLLKDVAEYLAAKNILLEYPPPIISRATWSSLRRYNAYRLLSKSNKEEEGFYRFDDSETYISFDGEGGCRFRHMGSYIELFGVDYEGEYFYESETNDESDESEENGRIDRKSGRRRTIGKTTKTTKTAQKMAASMAKRSGKARRTKAARMEARVDIHSF